MKKRALAALLCATMVIPTFSMAVAAEEIPTVSLHVPGLSTYSEEAIAEVEQAMSAITAEKYGFNVDLTIIEIGNYEKAVNLAMTTDEVDVACYFQSAGKLASYAANGQLLDITEQFANSSEEFQNTFTEAEIASASAMGQLLGVPRKYQFGGTLYAVFNAEMMEGLGIDAKTIDSYEKLEEVLYKAQEAYPDVFTLVPQSMAEMAWWHPWDSRIGSTSFLYAEDINSTELKSLFELDAFAKQCEMKYKWYQDGIIMPDVISNTIEGTDLVTAGTGFCVLHNGDIDPLETVYQNTVSSTAFYEPMAIATDIGNLQYGISANSAHPEEAFKLLEAIYTDTELATTLCYGVEGTHWVLNEEGKATLPEGVEPSAAAYSGIVATAGFPNYTICPLKDTAVVDDYKASVDEWNNSVKVTSTYGFYFDTTEYTDFMTAYQNIEDKYADPLLAGVIKLEDVLPSIQSELESIGFYEVLAEAQTQLDEFMAAK